MNYKIIFRIGIVAIASLATPLAFSEAPVVDLTSSEVQQDSALQPKMDQFQTAQSLKTAQLSKAVQPEKPSSGVTTDNVTNSSSSQLPASSAPSVSLPAEPSSLTVAQRLTRLEQQINNLTTMNLPQQESGLQEQVAQLRGQLQVQAHDLKLLNDQQRSFYQDLDQRITQLKNLESGSTPPPANNPKPNINESANDNSIQLKDSGAYQAAFSLMSQKKFDKSEAAFQNYLNDYPNGQYVANAHYWLGEMYLAAKNPAKAGGEFQTIVDKFPTSTKAIDAKLKLAIIHVGTGKIAQARREFTQIKHQHPNSTAAQLASIRLQQLNNTPNIKASLPQTKTL